MTSTDTRKQGKALELLGLKEKHSRAAVKVQVIGASFGRTGTSSFKKALEILGFGPCYHMMEVSGQNHAKRWKDFAENPSELPLLDSMLGGAGYRSTCDFPSSPYWKEQLELYPDAKVVLTARDPEKWYKSCCDTIFQMMPSRPGFALGLQLAYFFGISHSDFKHMLNKVISSDVFNNNWSKDHVIHCYNEHNADVLLNCPSEKLLVFEVTQGWAPLCEFLGVPVPDEPFPNVNDTKQFQAMVRMRACSGFTRLAAYASLAFLCGSTALATYGLV
jgi:hypothetical protein